MKRLTMVIACATMLCACGKNNDNPSTNNTTANNTTANNTTVNNTTVNNTTVNNTTVNNTTVNNTTVNNTTNTTNYTPYEWVCSEVTPSGTVDISRGTWSVTAACIGEDPYGPLYQLCAGAVITDFNSTNAGGFQHINADDTYVFYGWLDAEVGIFMPQDCVSRIGAGDCAATQGLLDTFVADAGATGTVTCADGPSGGCECDVSGQASVRQIGTITAAGEGTATLNFFGDAGAESSDWRFSSDGINGQWQEIATGSSWSAEAGGAATACEIYCNGFLANCNDAAGVTAYTDLADCTTQCAGFTVAGSEQTTGDSLECRTYHLYVSADASDDTNQATHCPHAQATATAPCAN